MHTFALSLSVQILNGPVILLVCQIKTVNQGNRHLILSTIHKILPGIYIKNNRWKLLQAHHV